LPACAVEIGLEIAMFGRQLAAEISEGIAADHVAGPKPTQSATAPAMSASSFFGNVLLGQLTIHTQRRDRIDKLSYLMQTHTARKVGQLLG
jgi:hypothetical protein